MLYLPMSSYPQYPTFFSSKKILIGILFFGISIISQNGTAQTRQTNEDLASKSTSENIQTDTVPKGKNTFFKKIGDYFRNANKPKPEKKFDISFIGGPQYSSATQFGIGIMAAGLYRSDRTDLSIQPSNVSFFGNVSTSGFYMLGIRGSHILPKDKYRLLYTVYFYSMPSRLLGNRLRCRQ